MAHFNKAGWLGEVPITACWGGGVASLKRGHMLGILPAVRKKVPEITLRISYKTCSGREDTLGCACDTTWGSANVLPVWRVRLQQCGPVCLESNVLGVKTPRVVPVTRHVALH